MRLRAFSLLDMKSGTYSPPFFMAHAGQAVRACIDIGSDLSTTVGRYPSDFHLVELGYFDDASGQLVSHELYEQLGTVAGLLPTRQVLANAHAEQLEAFVPATRANGVAVHSDERA